MKHFNHDLLGPCHERDYLLDVIFSFSSFVNLLLRRKSSGKEEDDRNKAIAAFAQGASLYLWCE